ncbi:hypothetical protein [Pelagicoccus mobilis]|uniref:Type II secretion system protein GspG C-terminal domain-containing protein n=1 Tax=Pelagicoccus mobilis TaxID=415221 RepID=A0A934RVD8_9BACT|nr:hypothetical protein [Pelagicoccus mobilis]MBK1877093.1 hypothetical protein [Pelagicoccus mobilis]
MSSKKQTLQALGFICVLVAFISFLLIRSGAEESPKGISLDRLAAIKQEIARYVETNGKAPNSLSELPLPEAELQDHYGEPFIYQVSEDSITVLSYGSDKEPGGRFFDKDFSVVVEIPRQN